MAEIKVRDAGIAASTLHNVGLRDDVERLMWVGESSAYDQCCQSAAIEFS